MRYFREEMLSTGLWDGLRGRSEVVFCPGGRPRRDQSRRITFGSLKVGEGQIGDSRVVADGSLTGQFQFEGLKQSVKLQPSPI